jgi:hypothetical protein
MNNDMNIENLKLEIDRQSARIRLLSAIRDGVRLIKFERDTEELENRPKL